jgi:hypothetical protein
VVGKCISLAVMKTCQLHINGFLYYIIYITPYQK